ncbi:DUF397 domain-containing protein [Streptomyces tateyamensis]|uniref:DUF397 domain-containing protein n=1 Tax=Streptomyces tateyamensis TaxID=565073 RepID=A0A2V4NCS3_9ACTN|nr:DUF397 domain-containing protein [Streptomyces tateyamensis]PYC81337.1 DUF397 domain-containing protein [Streptomyces tateyamensis]
MSTVQWRKSSYSQNDGGACVEVARQLPAVRDSKDPHGPSLTFPAASLAAFLAAVKSDPSLSSRLLS